MSVSVTDCAIVNRCAFLQLLRLTFYLRLKLNSKIEEFPCEVRWSSRRLLPIIKLMIVRVITLSECSNA